MGNILAILVLFAKFANIFLRQKIVLYGIKFERLNMRSKFMYPTINQTTVCIATSYLLVKMFTVLNVNLKLPTITNVSFSLG